MSTRISLFFVAFNDGIHVLHSPSPGDGQYTVIITQLVGADAVLEVSRTSTLKRQKASMVCVVNPKTRYCLL